MRIFLYQNLSNQEQLKKNIYEALILSVKSFSVSKLCKFSVWKKRQKLSGKKREFFKKNVLNHEKFSLTQHFDTQKVRYYSIFELPRNRRGGPLCPMGVVHYAPPG